MPTTAVSVRLAHSADRARWDRFVLDAAGGNLLQSWGWGELKQQGGWRVHRLLAGSQPQPDQNAANAEQATDGTGAPVSTDQQNKLASELNSF